MLPERNNQKGFSLIELIVVIAIGAIIATIAMPSIRSFIERYQTKGAARDVMSVLQLARSEAAKRVLPVAVEFTHGTGSSAGVRVFVDDGNNSLVYDSGEIVIRVISMPPGVQLSNADFGGDQITGFDSRGLPTHDGAVAINGPISAFSIDLGVSGRVKIE